MNQPINLTDPVEQERVEKLIGEAQHWLAQARADNHPGLSVIKMHTALHAIIGTTNKEVASLVFKT